MAKHSAERRAEKSKGASYVRWHLQFGWWALLVFVTLGFVLEGLHGFKVSWYLSVTSQVRREMWTLAHAHGTLLALVNIVFGLVARADPAAQDSLGAASRFLLTASILLPSGFFLGGAVIYGGDPGLGILLVPLGGVSLIIAIFRTARKMGSPREGLLAGEKALAGRDTGATEGVPRSSKRKR